MRRWSLFSLIAVLIMAINIGMANITPDRVMAASVTPTFVSGNQTCSQLAAAGQNWLELKIEPVVSGTYPLFPGSSDSITITVSSTASGPVVAFSSTIPIDAVFVKGGPDGNLYRYDPPTEVSSDTGLHAPVNPSNGNFFGLSHLSVCFDLELQVTKTATTSFTRTWNWTIDKTVVPTTCDLFAGDSCVPQYTVTVTRTGSTDSAWAVSGTITVHNPAPTAATVTGVTDTISGVGSAPVTCSGVTFPTSVAAGGTLNCTYSRSLPDGTNRTNTATATTSGSIGGDSGTAAVTFGAPTTVVNGTINVDDTNGSSWSFSSSGSQTYTKTFTCFADQGTHTNTATIRETGQSDTATVTVNCYALDVTKTATPSNDETFRWQIVKSANQSALTLQTGQTAVVSYTIVVTMTGSSSSGFGVTGTIAINNPAPIGAKILGVTDTIAGVGSATVTCSGVTFPTTLAAGGTLNCTYTSPLPDNTTRLNTAAASMQNHSYDSAGVATPTGIANFTGVASINFTGATVNQIDECVNVTDTHAGNLGQVCVGQSPKTFTYNRVIGPFNACGTATVPNTAAFTTNDTATTGSSSWLVTVTVPCPLLEGCTPGYWKNHLDSWVGTGFTPTKDLNTIFNAASLGSLGTVDLVQALDFGGGNTTAAAKQILLRAAVAALLNSASSGVDYPLTTAQVISQVNTALASNNRNTILTLAATLDGHNNLGCPLN